jgi:Tfp pilus assembly protein PilO
MEMQDIIKKYHNKAVNAAVVIAALVIAFRIYNNYAQEVALINKTKDTQVEKNIVLEKVSKTSKEIDNLKKFINKKELDSVINTIGDIAKDSSVDIVSISPATEENKPYYIKFFFDMRLSADSYHSIGKFISSLESSQDILNVETVSMDQSLLGPGAKNERISIGLRISTVLAK